MHGHGWAKRDGSARRAWSAGFLALHMLFLSVSSAYAQTPPPGASPQAGPGAVTWSGPAAGTDVVYLKDGQQVRGTLTELRIGQSAVIQLAQGQNATIRWDGIARIERNGQPIPLDAQTWKPQQSAPLAPALAPETMPYDSDKPIPTGYHLETKPRLGPLIAGSILSGIGLFGIVAMESSNSQRDTKNTFDVVWGLLFFGPGLPLLLVGLLSPKKYLRHDATSSNAFWNLPSPSKPPLYVGFGPTKDGGGLLTIGRQF